MKRDIQQTHCYTNSVQLSLYQITEIDKTEINAKGFYFCAFIEYIH